jgi:hypothetical protein
MQPIKVILRMKIMTGLDLGQHQHSMDIWFHRQLLVRDVLWCNNPFVYLWEAYNRVRFYLINIFKTRSNIPNARKWNKRRCMMRMMFYSSYWYYFFSNILFFFLFLPFFLLCLYTRLYNSSNDYLLLDRLPN